MILVVGAMQEEINDIYKQKDEDFDLLLTGIGKVNAAMKLSQYLANHRPDLILNIGFAGGNIAYHVNDVVLIDKVFYHDFDLSLFGYKKGQVPGFPEYFQTPQNLYEKIKKHIPNIKMGNLHTGDYFMTEPVHEPAVFDMEGASLYHVAHYYQIPIVSIKIISDVIGMDDHFDSYKKFEQSFGSSKINQVFCEIKEVL